MNKTDLKRLRIEERYVLSPLKFLLTIGVSPSDITKKISIHELHYILGDQLHHAGLKNVSADKIYRGEIFLIGTPNKFFPYYNSLRRIKQKKDDSKIQNGYTEQDNVPDLKSITIYDLYLLYEQTLDPLYFNELFDRCYPKKTEEQEPTRQKIYKRHFKKRWVSIDK